MSTSEAPRAGAEAPQYEFAPEENAVMAALAAKMRFVGGVILALGILVLVTAAGALRDERDIGLAAVGLMQILIGVFTRGAGLAFRAVVQTHGADITHLMEAVEQLRRLYTLQFWLIVASLAMLALAVVIAVAQHREWVALSGLA